MIYAVPKYIYVHNEPSGITLKGVRSDGSWSAQPNVAKPENELYVRSDLATIHTQAEGKVNFEWVANANEPLEIYLTVNGFELCSIINDPDTDMWRCWNEQSEAAGDIPDPTDYDNAVLISESFAREWWDALHNYKSNAAINREVSDG